jgi:2'-5' RNA ligase
MVYALVHYPTVDTQHIDLLRRKYDRQVDLIAPHITLMFPVPSLIGESSLVTHIENVLSGHRQFPIHIAGLEQSADHYLFLVLQEGGAEVVHLHDRLYTGMLVPYFRADLPYVPHVTLGSFENAELCSQALREAERVPSNYQCVVDRLHLVKINEDQSRIVWSKEFLLPTS